MFKYLLLQIFVHYGLGSEGVEENALSVGWIKSVVTRMLIHHQVGLSSLDRIPNHWLCDADCAVELSRFGSTSGCVVLILLQLHYTFNLCLCFSCIFDLFLRCVWRSKLVDC
ncbi:hypothetical protein POM88_015433 [Heracleum sosnowskyi]|uniref:Secreted protein n=1 Tax=Heracleum sosnowskyi TaxID=360622 RepID=A0AAD8MS14_9APIA|nr:hypothetical protein POM88_015433 [Heracleum sosnowskyi]